MAKLPMTQPEPLQSQLSEDSFVSVASAASYHRLSLWEDVASDIALQGDWARDVLNDFGWSPTTVEHSMTKKYEMFLRGSMDFISCVRSPCNEHFNLHSCMDTSVLCTSIQARYLPLPAPFNHHHPHKPTFYCRFFNVYTDQPVPAHSRLVYRLSVINLTHAYPGTYVFCFT
ncbi:hypothetical protein EI94DRAFT_596255 [Lactarius quietus]|nr:hypothetical protein EI94DRAFT_596255 [Lactarius quietus]